MRPCGIFGDTPAESILMNNAAWVLRRSPLFLTAGDGGQPFQPVHVRDMAALMVELGQSTDTSGEELDACGPDAPTALELFTALRDATGAPARVAPVGGWLSNATLTALTRPIDWSFCRADIPPTSRGDAAGGTWLFRGYTSLRRDEEIRLRPVLGIREIRCSTRTTWTSSARARRRVAFLVGSRRRRGRRVDIPVEPSRRRRGLELVVPSSARGDAVAGSWMFR